MSKDELRKIADSEFKPKYNFTATYEQTPKAPMTFGGSQYGSDNFETMDKAISSMAHQNITRAFKEINFSSIYDIDSIEKQTDACGATIGFIVKISIHLFFGSYETTIDLLTTQIFQDDFEKLKEYLMRELKKQVTKMIDDLNCLKLTIKLKPDSNSTGGENDKPK